MIADLGLSKIIKSSGANTRSGTLFYMAPEMAESDNYGFSVDIWALGLIFMEISIGELLREVLPGMMPPSHRSNFPPMELLSRVNNERVRRLLVGMLKKNVF